ncbi:MAG: gmr 4 [Sphingomonas bacterium]|nr:gmr 4 [Sphingomonas bacterium]
MESIRNFTIARELDPAESGAIATNGLAAHTSAQYREAAQLTTLINQLPGVVYRCELSLPWRMLYVSNQVEELTGYAAEDFLEHRIAWADIVHRDDLPGITANVGAGVAGGTPFSLDYRILHRSGDVRWVLEQGIVVRRTEDGPILEGFIRDNSERKHIESALLTSQSRLETVFDQALVGILHRDRASNVLSVNDMFCNIIGRSAQELSGIPLAALLHPDDAPANTRQFAQHIATGTPYRAERRYLRPDGSIIWCEIQVSFVRGIGGEVESAITVAVDITQRRRIDEQRIHAIEMLTVALKGADAGTFELDVDDFSVRLSPEAARIYGLPTTHEGFITRTDWLDLIHPDDAMLPPPSSRGPETKPRAFEFRLRERDGHVRWLRTLSHPIPIHKGERTSIIGLIFDDTERKEAEQRLQASEEHLRLVQEAAHIGSYHGDASMRSTCSKQFYRNLGLDEDTPYLTEQAYCALVHPEDLTRLIADRDAAIATRADAMEGEFRIIRADDGEVRWMFNRTRYLRDAGGSLIGAVGAHMDITDRRRAEEAARAGDALNLSITQASADCITLLDLDGRATFMNDHALAALNADCFAPLAGADWANCWPAEMRPSLKAAIDEARNGRVGRFNGCNTFAADVQTWWDVAITPVQGDSGSPTALLAISRDVSEQRQNAERVRWSATHDGLTGLLNRSAFLQQLQDALIEAQATGSRVGLLILDIDHFKEVNDERGHDAGDALLQVFAERLRRAVRASDTVARLGGDEFAVILRHLGLDGVSGIAPSLVASLTAPFNHQGSALDCRASVGAALCPDQGSTPDELMKNADLALYASKSANRGKMTLFAPTMRSEMQGRIAMLNLARDAIRENLIVPFYQPKVALQTGALVGFEALLRWRRADGEYQTPITIAEAFSDVELAPQIGEQMHDRVIEDMRRWIRSGVAFHRIAVNASAAEFRNDRFAERLLAKLNKAGVPPSMIEVEVTEETAFLGKNSDHVARALKILRAHGIRVGLDDFGTGFSSLSHLKMFAVDTLKIDRTFIRGVGQGSDTDDAAIVAAVLNLGKSLKIEVVAEGIEQESQAQFLRAHGCETAQGYLFGRPMPAAHVAALVESWPLAQHCSI